LANYNKTVKLVLNTNIFFNLRSKQSVKNINEIYKIMLKVK